MTDEECRTLLATHPGVLRYLDTFVDLDEYLRRNLLLCNAIDAREKLEAIRSRLTHRAPVWLHEELTALQAAIEAAPVELARYVAARGGAAAKVLDLQAEPAPQ